MWVCAPHLLPSPGAARFIYMFISLERRHIHFYSLCFQAQSNASTDTPNLPGHPPVHIAQTPLEESSAFDAVSEG